MLISLATLAILFSSVMNILKQEMSRIDSINVRILFRMNNNVPKQLDYDQRDQIPTFAEQFSIKILRLLLHMSYINRA